MTEPVSRIILPKDPFQIGVTPTGEPVWVDPKDLITTPDEKLELKSNMSAAKRAGVVDQMARVVLENATSFMNETFVNTAHEHGVNLLLYAVNGETNPEEVLKWAQKAGYSMIQDGLTSVIKVKDRVIRQMTAEVDSRFALEVSKRVMEMIKTGR